jgi:hypothetical protein
MESSFEQTLAEVWRQVLVENASVVELGGKRYPVRNSPPEGPHQVDFVFNGNEIRGLEQNPETKSRSAQMARAAKKVMQFLRRHLQPTLSSFLSQFIDHRSFLN